MKTGFFIYFSLIAVTIFWGGSFSAIKHLLDIFSPQELLMARFIPAALAFLIIGLAYYRKESLNILKNDFPKTLIVGLLGIPGYHLLLNYGETHISAGLASLIIGLNPTLTCIISMLMLKERPNQLRIAGLATSFLGLFILVRFGSGQQLSYEYLLAVFATVLCPTCWAFYTTISKPLTMKYPPIAFASVSTLVGTIPTLVFLNGGFFSKLTSMGPTYIFSLGFLSMLSTVIGNIVWMVVVSRISATRASSFVYLCPLFAVLIGIVFLGEQINTFLILGGLLIMSGVYVVNRKK